MAAQPANDSFGFGNYDLAAMKFLDWQITNMSHAQMPNLIELKRLADQARELVAGAENVGPLQGDPEVHQQAANIASQNFMQNFQEVLNQDAAAADQNVNVVD